MNPRVLIIILCYNGIEFTLACLASLQHIETPNVDVLIVDNGSGDGTPTTIRTQFPMVRIIENNTNLGFAAGNNVGLRFALSEGYDYALLLNNDTEVAPDALTQLLAVAELSPRIGMVGPTIAYYDQPNLIWSAGGAINWRRGVSSMHLLNQPMSALPADARIVDFVTGCALLCKREILEQVGLLDERFFMYFEEAEWCMRVKRIGYRIMHVPDALVLHKIPQNARADKPYVAYYMTRNRLLFLRSARAAMRTWFDATILQDLRTVISLSMRRKWVNSRLNRDAMIRGWVDFCFQRLGQGPY